MVRKYTNNYSSTLNGAITNVQTTITVTSATGLPTIGAGETYRLTIDDGTNIEVVEVTDDSSSPTLTVTRGVDGTSGTAFADGDTIELRATAASFEDVLAGDETPALVGPLDASASGVYVGFGGSSTTSAYNLTHSGNTPRLTGAANYYYSFTSSSLYMQAGTSFNSIEFNNDSDRLIIKTNNSERMQVDDSGVNLSNGAFTLNASATMDAGAAATLEIPNNTSPTMAADGQIAVDTSVTDWSHGVLKYYGGEEMGVVAMPIAQFTTPTDGYVVAYNATNDEFELVAGGGGGLANVVEDTTPQLGGNLDANTFNIDFDNNTGIRDANGNEQIRFIQTASAVNQLDITNAATGNAPKISTSGGDTNIDLNLATSGSGGVQINGSSTKITTILDEDTMTSDSATALATQQSIKAYVDSAVADISFSANRSTTQTIATATYTKMQINTESFDTNNDYDPTTNYRHTPTVAGKYMYVGCASISGLGSGKYIIVALYKNGSLVKQNYVAVPASLSPWLQVSGILDMNGTTDYVELYIYHNHGSNLNTAANSTINFLEGILVS